MIRSIVFDMGGVLIDYDVGRYIAAFADDPADQELLRREIFRSPEWIMMDRGTLTDLEARDILKGNLPQRLHATVDDLFANWHQDIPPIDDMYRLVEELKGKGYGIYLLSNTCNRFHDFRKNIPALTFFDGEFVSCDCGSIKPELPIYEKFLAAFSLDPGTCLFIDDFPANIEGAMRVGMHGVVYHGDCEDLRRKLRAAGVDC